MLAAKLEKTLHSIAERDMDSAQLERFLSAQVSKPSSVSFTAVYASSVPLELTHDADRD